MNKENIGRRFCNNSHNKNALFGLDTLQLHVHATVHVAVLTYKVIQGEWFSCHLKANMRPPISDQ